MHMHSTLHWTQSTSNATPPDPLFLAQYDWQIQFAAWLISCDDSMQMPQLTQQSNGLLPPYVPKR